MKMQLLKTLPKLFSIIKHLQNYKYLSLLFSVHVGFKNKLKTNAKRLFAKSVTTCDIIFLVRHCVLNLYVVGLSVFSFHKVTTLLQITIKYFNSIITGLKKTLLRKLLHFNLCNCIMLGICFANN